MRHQKCKQIAREIFKLQNMKEILEGMEERAEIINIKQSNH